MSRSCLSRRYNRPGPFVCIRICQKDRVPLKIPQAGACDPSGAKQRKDRHLQTQGSKHRFEDVAMNFSLLLLNVLEPESEEQTERKLKLIPQCTLLMPNRKVISDVQPD